MQAHLIEFEAFLETIKFHPRFNELRDVLPNIYVYLKPFLQPWEEDFQREYLNKLTNGNFLTWVYHLCGDTRKFYIKPSLIKKRKSYNLSDDCLFISRIIPYILYFPKTFFRVYRQWLRIPPHLHEFAGLLHPQDLYDFPLTFIRVYVYIDGELAAHDEMHYDKFDVSTEEKFYIFRPRRFISLVKKLMEIKVCDFRYCLEYKFRLHHAPNNAKVRPDFNLVFYRDRSQPIFYEVLA